jgi:hypothetical protein
VDPITVGGLAVGSFRKIILPIFKGVFKEIKAVGTKRAMTSARTLVDGLQARLADEKLTKAERRELRLLTKDEAQSLAQQILMDGLQISGGAADALIVAAVKAKNQGVDAREMGVKPEDEDDDDSDDDIG